MEKQEQADLDSWASFNDSEFLEAKRVRDSSHKFVIIGLDIVKEEGKKPQLVLELSSDEGKLVRKFGLNKTNGRFLEQNCPNPNDLVGSIITFKKVLVNNPKGEEVESLRIATFTKK